MIRVLIIAVLAFTALVFVTRGLPESAFTPAPPREAASPDAADLALREGIWEGAFEKYLLDGTFVESIRVRQVHAPATESGQRVEITAFHDDGRVVTSHADHVQDAGAIECIERREDGSLRVLQGRRTPGGLLWTWSDPLSGHRESFLERLVRVEGGTLLMMVTGVGIYGDEVMLFEGRYHRAPRGDG